MQRVVHQVIQIHDLAFDINQIKPGFWWYEGDVFSADLLSGLRKKAIVELVDKKNKIIYGDLTASQIYNLSETPFLTYYGIQEYVANCDYPCAANEQIVWYDTALFSKLYESYHDVKRVYENCRSYNLPYITSDVYDVWRCAYYCFEHMYSGSAICQIGRYRPVLALTLLDNCMQKQRQ